MHSPGRPILGIDLREYGSFPGSNITSAMLLAVKDCANGGRILVPEGNLKMDPIVVSLPAVSGAVYGLQCPNSPVSIIGAGPGITQIWGRPDAGQAMFRFDISGISGGTQYYGGLRDMSLMAEAPFDTEGDGVAFERTLFTNAERVWIRGFNRGLTSQDCQDQALRDVHCNMNRVGARVAGANQVRLESFYVNQNRDIGLWSLGGPTSWAGGLCQGNETIGGIVLEPSQPNNIRLDVRSIYLERGGTAPYVLGKAVPGVAGQYAGAFRMDDVNLNGGTSAPYQTDFDGYGVYASNWIGGMAGPWGRFLNGSLWADGLPPLTGRWKADAATAARTYWRGPGGIEVLP